MDLLHTEYLPFTEDQLRRHFAPVRSAGGAHDRHLQYYLSSLRNHAEHVRRLGAGHKPTPAETRRGRQIEKDERFWVAAALMSLYYDEPSKRVTYFADLLRRADVAPIDGFDSWEAALDGDLHLYFEVHLSSPRSYRQWLRNNVDERTLIPYLHEAASSSRLEGSTKLDALLLAPTTGVAVAFEAKVLSDISTHITFDVARNQVARTIDVLIDANPHLADPLPSRKPERSVLVLLTPGLFQAKDGSSGLGRSRLYGWLLPAYRTPGDPLLAQHLGHRRKEELDGVHARLGWATWEDCNAILPHACRWLRTDSRAR